MVPRACWLREEFISTNQGKTNGYHLIHLNHLSLNSFTHLEAGRMHEVTTGKSFDRRVRSEQEIIADWTIGFKAFLQAFVFFELHSHARVACHTMKEIDA
jgi:hypothetical protein